MASYGIVKLLDEAHGIPVSARAYPGTPWEPKEAFQARADHYQGLKEHRTTDRLPQ
ncbi:hypothetical protein [Streptomyces sp. NPDC001970]